MKEINLNINLGLFMDVMPLRIKSFFHASNLLVYPIFFSPNSVNPTSPQEENDQAFSVAL